MLEMMIIAVAAAIGLLILMFKLGTKKVLGYDIYFDIALTVLLMISLSGTFSGMVIALIAGLTISITLLILRKFIGLERYEPIRLPNGRQKYVWVFYPGWLTRSHNEENY